MTVNRYLMQTSLRRSTAPSPPLTHSTSSTPVRHDQHLCTPGGGGGDIVGRYHCPDSIETEGIFLAYELHKLSLTKGWEAVTQLPVTQPPPPETYVCPVGKEVVGRELEVWKEGHPEWVPGSVKDFDEPQVLHQVREQSLEVYDHVTVLSNVAYHLAALVEV